MQHIETAEQVYATTFTYSLHIPSDEIHSQQRLWKEEISNI